LSKQKKQLVKKEKYEQALQNRKDKMANKMDEKVKAMGSNLMMVMPLTEMMEKQKESEIEAEL